MPLKVGGNLMKAVFFILSQYHVFDYTHVRGKAQRYAPMKMHYGRQHTDPTVRDAQHTMPTRYTMASVHHPAHALLVTAVQDEDIMYEVYE